MWEHAICLAMGSWKLRENIRGVRIPTSWKLGENIRRNKIYASWKTERYSWLQNDCFKGANSGSKLQKGVLRKSSWRQPWTRCEEIAGEGDCEKEGLLCCRYHCSETLYVYDVYIPSQKLVENDIKGKNKTASIGNIAGALSTPQWSLCGSVIYNFRSRDKHSAVPVYLMVLIN